MSTSLTSAPSRPALALGDKRVVLAAKILGWLLLAAIAWELMASAWFMWATETWSDPRIPALRRPFLWVWYLQRFGSTNALTDLYFVGSAVGASAPFALVISWRYRAMGGFRGSAQKILGLYRVVRASSHTYGDADFASDADVAALLPAEPEPTIGGFVLGERVRLDLTPLAGVRYKPRIPATYGGDVPGMGGTAPLMFDHLEEGSGHGLVIIPSGGFKSTAAMTTLDYWRTSAFIFDPARELADMTQHWRAGMGHTVHIMDPGFGACTNVLKWIDPEHVLAEVQLMVTVERCYGKTPPTAAQSQETAQYFRDQGRNMFAAILGHILWSDDVPADLKTLRTARRVISLPDDDLRAFLENVAYNSPLQLARDLAAPLYDLTKVTFDGIKSNAQQGTTWLSNGAFADMVSNDDFDFAQLCDGKTTVYCQIDIDALEAYPEIGRAIVSAAINSVMRANGRVLGRVLYLIDEADMLGAMGALRTVRERGRKHKCHLMLCYLSDHVITDVWGETGKNAWHAGVSWRMYGAISDQATAEAVSRALGSYDAETMSHSHNTSRSAKMMEIGSTSTSSGHSKATTARPLMLPQELMRMRRDERIIFYTGSRPIRCRAPIAFNRPEMRDRIGETNFNISLDRMRERMEREDPRLVRQEGVILND